MQSPGRRLWWLCYHQPAFGYPFISTRQNEWERGQMEWGKRVDAWGGVLLIEEQQKLPTACVWSLFKLLLITGLVWSPASILHSTLFSFKKAYSALQIWGCGIFTLCISVMSSTGVQVWSVRGLTKDAADDVTVQSILIKIKTFTVRWLTTYMFAQLPNHLP